jgi:hypothetical protein
MNGQPNDVDLKTFASSFESFLYESVIEAQLEYFSVTHKGKYYKGPLPITRSLFKHYLACFPWFAGAHLWLNSDVQRECIGRSRKRWRRDKRSHTFCSHRYAQ